MAILSIPAFKDNYIWTLLDIKNRVFDCIDPGDASPILQFAKTQNVSLRAILLTHHHSDHIGGVPDLIKAFPNALVYGPSDPRIPYVTHPVTANDEIQVGQYHYKILFNPGHTSTHISYYEPQQHWLFCGDTLFSAGCGRVFDGSMETLYESMQLFKSLPLNTQIFCAHEYTLQNLRFAQNVEPHNQAIQKYLQQLNEQERLCTLPSSLEVELAINPFLRTESPEVQSYAQQHGASSSSSLEVFRILREQKNIFQ